MFRYLESKPQVILWLPSAFGTYLWAPRNLLTRYFVKKNVKSFLFASTVLFSCTKVPHYNVSKFSQDLERLLAPIFSIRIRALSLVGVKHPALRSVISKLDDFLFLTPPMFSKPPGLAGFRPRRFRSGLRRICFKVPTNKSSTLWFKMADTSMYFESKDSAVVRPSVIRTRQ